MIENDGELSESNFQDGMMPYDIGPDGVPLRRNPSDIMNNMFINIVSIAYTRADSTAASNAENVAMRRGNKSEKELASRKPEWKEQTLGLFEQQIDKFEKHIRD